ncbi:uncharacterized mitochondrial protein-like protein [Tanacetum coccineum]
MASDHVSSDPAPQCPTTALEHGSLNISPLIISTPTEPTIQAPTQEPPVTASVKINQADIQAQTQGENVLADEDEFINIFSTPVHEMGESSSQHVDLSNMNTFYQRNPSEYHWAKDYPLKQGIRIHQSPRGIFINQAKYAQEILKKHGMTSCDSIGTPVATKPLDADLSGTLVDQTKYRSMVGALMYLTTSRPDIVHATCYCARYQARPTEKHLKEVKRIFWYLKNTIHMGLWYPKDIDDEPMWAANHVVTPTPGSAITIPKTANEFAIKADLGASINLMPYSLYAKLSLETLKPTKMSVRLADRSFQYPVGIAKNMLVEVGKFTFPVDFVIPEMEEYSKVLLILG